MLKSANRLLAIVLFVAGRYETLDRAFGTYRPIVAVMSGGRVRF